MIDTNVIGKGVRELRLALGWTQIDLAGKSDLSQGEVCKIEKGQWRGGAAAIAAAGLSGCA